MLQKLFSCAARYHPLAEKTRSNPEGAVIARHRRQRKHVSPKIHHPASDMHGEAGSVAIPNRANPQKQSPAGVPMTAIAAMTAIYKMAFCAIASAPDMG
jgi:hypothetical protein